MSPSSCVTPAGTSTSQTSRVNRMTTHTHTHIHRRGGRDRIWIYSLFFYGRSHPRGNATISIIFARLNSKARTGTGEYPVLNFPVQLTTSRIGNLTRLIHTLLYVMTIHTYIISSYGRPGSSEVPRNPLTRWDVSSIPANGIFLTKNLKKKKKMPNGWRTIKSLVHKIQNSISRSTRERNR